jgi:ribonuclease D
MHTQPDASLHAIQTDGALMSAIPLIVACPEIALDTEFHAERRYHPELMLVQISAPDGTAWLIDPLSVDITPLVVAIADCPTLVHAGINDLAILWRYAHTAPTTVFDVQMGAGMLGLGYPTRLGTLTHHFLGEELNKKATLSDWSHRPLTKSQLQYAAQDARTLFPLASTIRAQLKERGRLHWVEEESLSMGKTAQQESAAEHLWRQWDIASFLDEETQRVLHSLIEWRNQKGRDKNQPAPFILSNGIALDIARRKPTTLEELGANRRIPQGLIRRIGQEVVSVIQYALSNAFPIPPVPTPDQRRIASAISFWAQAIGNAIDIAPKLLIPDALGCQIAIEGSTVVDGWRREAIGSELEAFLTGSTGVFIGDAGSIIR